jgi:hypothetical protein
MGITLCRAAESLSKIEPQLSWRVQQYAVDVMKMQSKLVELSPLIGATMSDLNLVDLVQKTTERLKALQMPVGVSPDDIITPEERKAILQLREIILGSVVKTHDDPGLGRFSTVGHPSIGKVLATAGGRALYTCSGMSPDTADWIPYKISSVPEGMDGVGITDGCMTYNGRRVYQYTRDLPGQVNGNGHASKGGIWAAITV